MKNKHFIEKLGPEKKLFRLDTKPRKGSQDPDHHEQIQKLSGKFGLKLQT